MEFISNFGYHTKTFYKSVWQGERVSIQAIGKPTITSIQNDSCDQISVHTEGITILTMILAATSMMECIYVFLIMLEPAAIM